MIPQWTQMLDSLNHNFPLVRRWEILYMSSLLEQTLDMLLITERDRELVHKLDIQKSKGLSETL